MHLVRHKGAGGEQEGVWRASRWTAWQLLQVALDAVNRRCPNKTQMW